MTDAAQPTPAELATAATPLAIPRVVVAAPASSHGKTTVATGLIAALRAKGLRVSPHKVGPDYIDPSYHALAAGRPGRNLDPWLVGERLIAPLFAHGALTPDPADVAVIEGVMGLYDGAGGRDDFASTAHVARLLDAPVIVVLDAGAQSRTAAAVALGMQAFDPRLRVAGVVLNRVATDGHERLLREAFESIDLPIVGVLRHADTIAAPSRHLGLIPAAERSDASTAAVAELADLIAASVDLDAVLDLARSAPPLHTTAWDAATAVGGPARTPGSVRIAVAGGRAFTFGYTETTELLTAAGADVVRFDPTHDPALPPGTRAVVIGGGFPEEHAEALVGNASLRAELAAFDGSIVAECAGLLYLAKTLDGQPMCGRLDAHAAMAPGLVLGYRDAVTATDSVLGPAGRRVHGHEFHRTVCTPGAGVAPAWEWDGMPHGFVAGGVHASYLHTHWAAWPDAARHLVEAAAR